MFKMCEKCGYMYDDSCGPCPQCNSGSAEQPNGQKVESENKSVVSQQATSLPITSTISNNTNKSSRTSSSSGGSGIPKPVIAVLVLGFIALIVAVIVIFAPDLIKGIQNLDIGGKYEDSYQVDADGNQLDGDSYESDDALSDEGESKITVYFDYNNGEPVKQVEMVPGYVDEPETPVRYGYLFAGWYDINMENKWDFDNSEAHESMTLYAKWEQEGEGYSENEKIVLAVDGLRLRESPDISGKKIGLIPNGTIITVENTVDGWSYTTYKGKSGWCSSDFLYNPADYEGEVLFEAYVDNKNGLTLYVNEDVNSTVINSNIGYKSIVYVYEVDDKWSYVSYGDEYGWCLSEYLDDF